MLVATNNLPGTFCGCRGHFPTGDLASSTSLVVRGQESDEATLHTENKSYTVRDVQTSNTLLLAKPSHRSPTDFAPDIAADPSVATELANDNTDTSSNVPAWLDTAHVYELQDCLSNYLELTLTQPRVGKLRDILEKYLYAGPEEEANVDRVRFPHAFALMLMTCADVRLELATHDAKFT